MKTSNMPPTDMKALHGLQMKLLAFDDNQGEIEAIVSVFNNADRADESIPFGAFKDSLAKKLPKGVWGHDWLQPIAKTLVAKELPPGDPMLTEENKHLGGLYIKGQFNLETQRGRESYSDIKKGIVDEFSIGYRVTKSSVNDGVTVLEEIELFEWSPVLVGCNPATSLISIKSAMQTDTAKNSQTKDLSALVHFKGDYLGENIESSLAYGALYDLGNSLGWAFYSIIYGAGTPEDKVAQVGEACDEFKAIAIKVVNAVLAEDATAEDVEKAFNGICHKAFTIATKEGRTFSAATKEAIGEKVKAFKAIAKDLNTHAKDIEGMMSKTDAPDDSDSEGVHLVGGAEAGEGDKSIPDVETKTVVEDLSQKGLNEMALLEASLLESTIG